MESRFRPASAHPNPVPAQPIWRPHAPQLAAAVAVAVAVGIRRANPKSEAEPTATKLAPTEMAAAERAVGRCASHSRNADGERRGGAEGQEHFPDHPVPP